MLYRAPVSDYEQYTLTGVQAGGGSSLRGGEKGGRRGGKEERGRGRRNGRGEGQGEGKEGNLNFQRE